MSEHKCACGSTGGCGPALPHHTKPGNRLPILLPAWAIGAYPNSFKGQGYTDTARWEPDSMVRKPRCTVGKAGWCSYKGVHCANCAAYWHHAMWEVRQYRAAGHTTGNTAAWDHKRTVQTCAQCQRLGVQVARALRKHGHYAWQTAVAVAVLHAHRAGL